MTIFGKLLFLFIVILIYSSAFLVARTNSIRALEKIFLSFFTGALFFSIIFSEKVFSFLSIPLGVDRGSDTILYLFIIVSTSINLILFRKIIELENKLTSVLQKFSEFRIINQINED